MTSPHVCAGPGAGIEVGGVDRHEQGFVGGGGLSTQRVRDAVLNVLSLEKEGSRGTEGQPAPNQVLTVMHSHLNLTGPAHFEQR